MNPIAVVICNYNKKDYVIKCVASVLSSHFHQFDLIVVDNASTDGSAAALTEHYGNRLTLLENEENTGGSGGFHRGMQLAMDKGYRYIHLLDNDVILEPEAIGALYEFMESHPSAGACGSLIGRIGTGQIQDFGAMIDQKHLVTIPLWGGQDIEGELPESVECDYVAACSAMYRTDALKLSGIIDKDFFVYWDDVSLCWEIRWSGSRVYACSRSVAWHHRTSAVRTGFNRYYSLRNKIYCFTRFLPDEAFYEFGETLIKMMFRTFSVNRCQPQNIQNYFHALCDGLNNIRGKAEPYKLITGEPVTAKFAQVLANKRRILILYDPAVTDLAQLVKKINSVTDANITICDGQAKPPEVSGVSYTDVAGMDYDLIIQLCYHVLDVTNYDHTKIYIDKFTNEIMDKADFDFCENYDTHYQFFYDVFSRFIKTGLETLRREIGKKP